MPLVAISADDIDESKRFAKEGRLSFPLLSDSNLLVAEAYGVAMKGDDIAIPATIVISPAGVITYKKVGETQIDRADVDVVLAEVDKLLAS